VTTIGTGVEAVLVARLRAAGLRLATAESTTGGLIGHRLAAVPGASAVLAGGIAAYANEAKTRLLGVPEALLAEHGAVSPEVAAAMARGACEAFDVTVAIAETGVAGPPSDGATEAKPPGLYYLAAIGPGCELAERATFEGRRAETQWAASEAALRLALVCLEGATSVDDEPTSSTPTSDAERERHG
jgi:PncC family amidohydrolase